MLPTPQFLFLFYVYPLQYFFNLHGLAKLQRLYGCVLRALLLSSQTIPKRHTPVINMSDKSEKLKALQLTIDKLEKTYGKGAVMKLSDDKVVDLPSIPTGSLGLDIALGIGGIPRGRIIEIYGPESSGKTTLTMHCIAEAQKKGGLAAFIDASRSFSLSCSCFRLSAFGVISRMRCCPSKSAPRARSPPSCRPPDPGNTLC